MSKAFTREDDDLPDRPALKMPRVTLPPGVKNYFTPDGLEKLRQELERLGDSAEDRQRAFEIEQCARDAIAVPAPEPPSDQVLFGASVTVRDQHGEETTYRIVGAHEMELDRNWISWLSPLAKSLLKSRVGDRVRFRAPAGEQHLEILGVRYTTPV